MNTNPMTAREYLEQALDIEREIDAKMAELEALRALSTRITATLSDMPRASSGNPQTLENTVVRIVTVEKEIDAVIDRMLDMKHEIVDFLKSLPDAELRKLLICKYIGFQNWAQIAKEMKYSVRYTYTLHDKALEMVEAILPDEKRVRKQVEANDGTY